MTQTAIVVHRSKSKMIRLFLGALVFVALGALITKVIYDEQGAGAFRVFIGLFTMLFFGVFAIAGLVKLLDKRPALEFLNEGLLARDISATPIRWEDIEAARLLTYRQRPAFANWMRSPLSPMQTTGVFSQQVMCGLRARAFLRKSWKFQVFVSPQPIAVPSCSDHVRRTHACMLRWSARMGAACSDCSHSPNRCSHIKRPGADPAGFLYPELLSLNSSSHCLLQVLVNLVEETGCRQPGLVGTDQQCQVLGHEAASTVDDAHLAPACLGKVGASLGIVVELGAVGKPRVQAKIEAIELVEVSSPFWCWR